MTPETQISHLVRHIGPLVHYLENYRPSAKRIHIHRYDWEVLHQNPAIATANGFVIESPERITYRKFDLIPIETHKRKL
jgi:hypothetical protein